MIPNIVGIATLGHRWLLQPSFPFRKNSRTPQSVCMFHSVLFHTSRWRNSLGFKTARTLLPPAPWIIADNEAAVPSAKVGNASSEELCGQVLLRGRPHQAWESNSQGEMYLGHYTPHTHTLNSRFPRPTLPTPSPTRVPPPGEKSRKGWHLCWHLAALGPHPQCNPWAENVPRANARVKPSPVSSDVVTLIKARTHGLTSRCQALTRAGAFDLQ